MLSDNQLIVEVRSGNKEAFKELVLRYTDKAFCLALKYTKNPSDAEEVLQDVLTVVFRKINSFEGKASFSSWFYRVTVNCALMFLRKKRQDRSTNVCDITLEIEKYSSNNRRNYLDNVERDDLAKHIEAALAKLPEDYRTIFILKDVDGLSSKEVGYMLGLTVAAVKSRLHRARLLLRASLTNLYGEYSEVIDYSKASCLNA